MVKNKPSKIATKTQALKLPQKTFLEHLAELRRRLVFVGLAVLAGATATYAGKDYVITWLLRPAGDQQFIFTTPGGGFDFLLRLCLYGGLLVCIPALIYQLLRFVQPLIQRDAHRFVMWGGVASVLLALLGIAFGYFIGLPAAMHFLLVGFSGGHISALITIQSYLTFMLMYLIGCALLFQTPLILVLANRIKPLQPKTLFTKQRWFIVAALVVGAVVNPSPNIQDQLMLSVPMIAMYQLGIVLVWLINRRATKTLATQTAYDLQ